MVTSKALYNLKGEKIKRKIEVALVTGLTYSSISSEFAIHVGSQYDYRYSSHELRNDIMKSLLYVICKTAEFIPFYYVDMINLNNVITTEKMKKKGVSKMPDQKYMDKMNYDKFVNLE